MLPTPCGWILFSSAFVQRHTLANQLNQIFQAETNIDTPFQCIWGNIYGIGDFKKTTAPAIQIKCHPSHKIAIQTLLLSLVSPLAIDNQDPRYIFQRQMVFLSPDMLTIPDADYVQYSKVAHVRGFFSSYLRFFARSVLAHFRQYTDSFSHCTGSF